MEKDQLIQQVQLAGQHESRVSLLFRHHLAAKANIPPTDMECLEIIADRKQTTPGELSRETGLSSGAMTAALNRMEKKKLITRSRSSTDRRKVVVEPIQDNVGEIYSLYKPFVTSATALLSQYSADELRIISSHYRAMAAIYEAQLQDV